jgi:hypothetical protein
VLHQCVEKEDPSIPKFDLISVITAENWSPFQFLLK